MKLSIALVTAFLFALGGVAHAQAPDPDQLQTSGVDIAKTAACPVVGSAPPAQGNAEYEANCAGYKQGIDPSQAGATSYLCDVSAALIRGINDNGGAVLGAPLAGARGQGCAATPDDDPDQNTPPPTSPPGGGAPPGVRVLNQADDGGLPRTGAGELLSGIGLGLTSLGALVRRFLL
ncbi:MAG TPA: hypothetical protein VI916_01760 [Acidimicrobiia bacterium]|nr:hypothetical protein [Acidimicrobiia bacterium]